MHVMAIYTGKHDETRTTTRTSNIAWRPLAICIFFVSFPKKSMDYESQKSGFRFDLIYPFRVWILWIYDLFLDFPKRRKIRFWIQESVFWFSQKKRTLKEELAQHLSDTWHVLMLRRRGFNITKFKTHLMERGYRRNFIKRHTLTSSEIWDWNKADAPPTKRHN